MTELLSSENKQWLDKFREQRGRCYRVLLIGNIANNAYNNAKILNEAGLDCDVICYDYYHIMGCPEWEDADLAKSPKNDFRPDWTKVDLRGFIRPKWFAQGPLNLCIEYLISRRTGAFDVNKKWRRLLIFSLASRPITAGEHIELFRLKVRLKFIPVWQWLCSKYPKFSKLIHVLVKAVFYRSLKLFKKKDTRYSAASLARDDRQLFDENSLVEAFAAEFPGRADKLTAADFGDYIAHRDCWTQLFSLYDAIIGFSVDPFIPLISGVPYFGFEHGTLREIPFVPDSQGRRTALAYRLAKHCFVTNFDCAGNAELLTKGRYTLINHPYDEDHGTSVHGAESMRNVLLEKLDCDFLFFHPTRQDWVPGTGYADKANDVFLEAFASLRNQGLKVGLVACKWGANVIESQTFLNQLGVGKYVLWISPQAITPFERICMASDVVVDQFKLGAFGGVVFKAMAVGSPVITFINETLVTEQYSELPPVINCPETSDIVMAVRDFYFNPHRLEEQAKLSRSWIKRHHGKFETINKQIDQFRISCSN